MPKRILIVFCLLLLGACKPAKEALNKYWNDGTVEGASQCVAMTSELLLSEEAIRRSCITQFEQRMTIADLENVDGRAAPRTRSGEDFFSGGLLNGSQAFVVTRLIVGLRFVGESTEDVNTYNAEVLGWFEPSSDDVEFVSKPVEGAHEDWSGLSGCEDAESTDCWSWGIEAAWGLAL